MSLGVVRPLATDYVESAAPHSNHCSKPKLMLIHLNCRSIGETNQVIPSSEMICQTSKPLPSPIAKSPAGTNQSAELFSRNDEVRPSPSAYAVVSPDAVMETNITFE